MKQLSGNFSTFLTLLTTQLKNQDPTSPMDSNQFTQQLVMYSQVEQQISTNDNLKTLITQGTSNAAAMTTGYLGKKVSITNGNASLSGGTATWTYNLANTAASTPPDTSHAARCKVICRARCMAMPASASAPVFHHSSAGCGTGCQSGSRMRMP